MAWRWVLPCLYTQPLNIPTGWAVAPAVPTAPPASASEDSENKQSTVIAALPLGGRIKLDPWSDQLEMIKSQPVGAVAEYEKKPFEVTPIVVYLTRRRGKPSSEVTGAISMKFDTDADDDEGTSSLGVKP